MTLQQQPGTKGKATLQWNTKDWEIRTKSVEEALRPLITQVTTLVSSKHPKKMKGKSKTASELVLAIDKAIASFIQRGQMIAKDNPEIEKDMLSAIENVKASGQSMSRASREFAADPLNSSHRSSVVQVAKQLLSAVTKLLVLADMIDVQMLLRELQQVETDLERLKAATSESDLKAGLRDFDQSSEQLLNKAAQRQRELMDPDMRDDLSSARAMLKRSSVLLMTSTKTHVKNPELAGAKENRDFVMRQVCEAITNISNIAHGRKCEASHAVVELRAGQLAKAFDHLDQLIIVNPVRYDERKNKPAIEAQLESILGGAAIVADASCTRDERKNKILKQCETLQNALQDLLQLYSANAGKKPTKELNSGIIDTVNKSTRLRRQLRRAVADNISDTYLEAHGPLQWMISAAKEGNQKDVAELAEIFAEHSNKIVEVAHLACSMSHYEDGVKMVKAAALEVQSLSPQVIFAAQALAAKPNSKSAEQNMDVFQRTWLSQVTVMLEAVDDITKVEDFLSSSETHILDDMKKCLGALQDGDSDALYRSAHTMQSRTERVSSVVTAEMDNFEPGLYTERVLQAIKHLNTRTMPEFASKVKETVKLMNSDPPGDVDENDFMETTLHVFNGVRDIREAVLLNRSSDEVESETESEAGSTVSSKASSSAQRPPSIVESLPDEFPEIEGISTAREVMRQMPEEERQKVQKEVEVFHMEKEKFDLEVSKWDDSGNDLIVLAKHMCMIMMEMTDFTRGEGPLQTTMAVINAAKRISEAGTKLDKLARQIADQCPESPTKKDLLAYLQQIPTYCHQLNMTSKVKANVQQVSNGALIVSGLDSATSLIQAAKNLMSAVVSTVKASYVASTKYLKHQKGAKSQVVVWKMKIPDKKPLVRREQPVDEEIKVRVRRDSIKRPSPLQLLSEFQDPNYEQDEV